MQVYPERQKQKVPCEARLDGDIPYFDPVHCSTLADKHNLFITFSILYSNQYVVNFQLPILLLEQNRT